MKDFLTEANYGECAFRLVGVITIGVTRIPVVSFGYPESMVLADSIRRQMLSALESHKFAMLKIQQISPSTDRVYWYVMQDEPSEGETIQSPVHLYLDLPMERDNSLTGTRLFVKTTEIENGFMVAVTIEDRTLLSFYTLKNLVKSDSGILISGKSNSFVSGDAVPLLRTFHRMDSRETSQRRIEVPDEELGIIYKMISGA